MSATAIVATNTSTLRMTTTPIPSRSDESLFQSMAQYDDEKALNTLFCRYYDHMCRYVYTIVRCKLMTEEVVSDVFAKIWNQRQTLNIQTSVKAYLLVSVRNLSIDYLRREARRRVLGVELIHPNIPSDYTSAHETVVGNETNRVIEAAIERLPKQGRLIFRLSRDGGMKYREIADQLGISIKTVETHMTRSLMYLRQEVMEQLEG
jgi:RNA polymerase sigma-70 factor, ECF subfamily